MPPSADSFVLPPAKALSSLSKPTVLHVESCHVPEILDIRRRELDTDLRADVVAHFKPTEGPRTLPTLLLYDEQGLRLFEEITYLDEYYLTNNEAAILATRAAEMAAKIPQGGMIVELGSGNLRKVSLLLRAFEQAGKHVDYYALDLSRRELERTLGQLPYFVHVSCHGLLGTYDDGREWLKSPAVVGRQKCIMTLGSSIANFPPQASADFLRSFAAVLGPDDCLLVGLDSCTDPRKIYHAYNDKQGVTHRFVLNGLAHANAVLGTAAFQPSEWRVIGECTRDLRGSSHQAFVSPIRPTVVMGETVRPGERIHIEESWKYTDDEAESLWHAAGLLESCRWTHPNGEHGLHMLVKPKVPFSLLPAIYAKTALPTLEDWKASWEAWDTLSRRMLPHEELLEKPIKLRNACIFYLGHLPTFLDIQLNKTTGGPLTEPASYARIFERGIDPDVDNPELCHSHSEIPDEWPLLEEILVYQGHVRDHVRALYRSAFGNGGNGQGGSYGHAPMPRPIARALWAGFEHDVMHLETLLYMMLQSDKTLPPPDAPMPDFAEMAHAAHGARVPNQWFNVPARDISIGLDDPDDGTDTTRNFGWDNEKPVRRSRVHAFQAKGRPITNEEYAEYMWSNCIGSLPASWAHVQGGQHGCGGQVHGLSVPVSFLKGKAVRTVYGLVPLEFALDWPVFASYDEMSACAAWMGGRIPTHEEARSIYEHVEASRKPKEEPQGKDRALQTMKELLSLQRAKEATTATKANDLFIDLSNANVGLQHWHPMPVTGHGNRLAGQSEMGGVWEWTSTALHQYDGFEPMKLYPLYTADFFDGKHNIVLGGSWATHPRIAGRKSFVNWYQRNYPYAWVGARLVRDV